MTNIAGFSSKCLHKVPSSPQCILPTHHVSAPPDVLPGYLILTQFLPTLFLLITHILFSSTILTDTHIHKPSPVSQTLPTHRVLAEFSNPTHQKTVMASRANPTGFGGAGARQFRGGQSMPPPPMAGGPAPPRSSHRPASNAAPRVDSHHPSRQASHHPSRNLAPATPTHGMLPPRSSRAPASSHRAPQPSYHSSRQQHPPLDFGRSGPPPIPYE
jgi:hypothetical protein